jgi:hypothetical protein
MGHVTNAPTSKMTDPLRAGRIELPVVPRLLVGSSTTENASLARAAIRSCATRPANAKIETVPATGPRMTFAFTKTGLIRVLRCYIPQRIDVALYIQHFTIDLP